MKKVIFILFAFIISGMMKINADNHRVYAVFVVEDRSGSVVLIQETTKANGLWGGPEVYNRKFLENCLKDENGKDLKFNNFLPALGYIQNLGWTVPDIQDQIIRNLSNASHGSATFLLYKDVSESEWLQWIENGIQKN